MAQPGPRSLGFDRVLFALVTPIQRFVTSQRLRISCWDWGNPSAPTLLLVHGGRDHARSWDRIAEAFRDDYHVVALDLRGHGDSDWSIGGNYGLPDNALDVAAVIESSGAPARILAHSYGGSVSLVTAGTFPALVSRLAVMEGTHSLNPPDQDHVGVEWMRNWARRLRGFETQESRPYPSLQAAEARMREANPRLPADFLPHLAAYASRPVEGGYMWKYDLWVNGRSSMELRRDELPEFWEAVECPVLLVTGSESAAAGRQHPNPEAHLREVRRVQVEGAGHWIHHDQKDALLAELRPFFAD